MKNEFEKEYEQEQEIRARFEAAEEAGNDKLQDDARADYFRLSDSIEEKGQTYAKLYRYYSEAQQRKNNYIDLNEVVWDKDVPDLIEGFRSCGIDHFTFSSSWSSAIETAWLFTENGCSLEGLIRINSAHKDFETHEFTKVPAYLFRIG